MSIILPYHYEPRDYQLPLLKALDGNYKRACVVWHRRCLARGTKIAMSDGNFKNIEDVERGDYVLSYNGNVNYLTSSMVLNVFNNGKANVCKYNDLWATPNHEVLSRSKSSWTEIGNSDCLINGGGLNFGKEGDPQLAEILGLLLSDGSVKINQTPKFTNSNECLLERFEELIKDRFTDIVTKRYKKERGVDITCATKVKTNFHPLRKYFTTSDTFHEIIWSFDRWSSLAFLAGVIAGNGCISFRYTKTPRGFTSISGYMVIEAGISEQLAKDYKLLLLKFGIRAKIKKDTRCNNYMVFVYSLKSLHGLLGIEIPHKKKAELFKEVLKNTTPYNNLRQEKIKKSKFGNECKVTDVYDLEVEDTHNYVANGYIVHNCGKDKTLINLCVKKMFERVGIYYYFFPTYAQGKKIIWDGIDGDGFKFIDHFPEEIVQNKNGSEMKITVSNGSVFQIIGTDKYDAVRGSNPVGCIFSEYAYQNPAAWDVVRPILNENGGWACFNSTPQGENHFYDLHMMAIDSDDWFTQVLTIDDTKRPDGTPVIKHDDVERERAEGMADEKIMQEFYCSFESSNVGACYGKQMLRASEDGRIGKLDYDPDLPVNTYWDIGVADATVIWFVQVFGKEVRLIDYHEDRGEGLSHYINIIKSKPYVYKTHYFPHDMKVREWGSSKSREDTAREYGLNNYVILPASSVMDGIDRVRMILQYCIFDKERCKHGIRALKGYQYEYDEVKKKFKKEPLHNWASHGADAFRALATDIDLSLKLKRKRPKRRSVRYSSINA